MFKNLKLGVKLNGSFIAVAGLTLILGALAIFSMLKVKTVANVLALHNVTYVGDLSGVTHDPRTGQLVVVSDESRKVCWTTLAGELVSARSIPVTKAGKQSGTKGARQAVTPTTRQEESPA